MSRQETKDEIQDTRREIEFRGITFSGYKKEHVKKEFMTSLLQSQMEPAFYWSVELICAGHFIDLWDILLHFFSRHVHLGNPKLSLYLDMRAQQFKSVVVSHLREGNPDTLSLRNEPNIRRLFAEIICLLCESKQKHGFDEIKIKSQEEFNLIRLSEKLQATHDRFASSLLDGNPDIQDPQELFIPINELAFHVSPQSKNGLQACYWMEWIMEYVKVNKHLSHACIPRSFTQIETSKQKEAVWLIWDILIQTAKRHHTPLVVKFCESLFSLYTLKYGTQHSQFKKRKFLMYFVVSLLTEPTPIHPQQPHELVTDKERIGFFINQSTLIYRQIKKNEKNDSLHSGNSGVHSKELTQKEKNLRTSLAKIEILNQKFGKSI